MGGTRKLLESQADGGYSCALCSPIKVTIPKVTSDVLSKGEFHDTPVGIDASGSGSPSSKVITTSGIISTFVCSVAVVRSSHIAPVVS